MRGSSPLTEAQLEALERQRDPGSIPQLVSTLRQQQQELDSLRLGLDVARRDREELRAALLAAHAEIQRLRDAAGGRRDPSADGG